MQVIIDLLPDVSCSVSAVVSVLSHTGCHLYFVTPQSKLKHQHNIVNFAITVIAVHLKCTSAVMS